MAIREEILSANEQYGEAFDKGDLPMPPGRAFAVVTCMDARLDPAKFLGLGEGDAHVIRNAGGLVSDDALRSLVISHHLLGTQAAFVIGHTDRLVLGNRVRLRGPQRPPTGSRLTRPGRPKQINLVAGIGARTRLRKGAARPVADCGKCGKSAPSWT